MKTADYCVDTHKGLTRVEVLVLISIFSVWFACLLPLLAAPGQEAKLAVCASHLRVVGQAMRLWGNDHGDRNPIRTPWSQGGTFPNGSDPWGGGYKPGALWFEWLAISNELGHPKFLVCPADMEKRVAERWDVDSEGGFLHPVFRDNAVSYVMGTDVLDWTPRSILGADRNLRYDVNAMVCSARINNASGIRTLPGETVVRWTNSIHGPVGNLLFQDGAVERHSTTTLRGLLDDKVSVDGILHFLPPR